MIDLYFDGPGTYLVTTKNRIKSEFMEIFPVEICAARPGNNAEENSYTLTVRDQSELMGFLNSLYNEHHTIVKVEHLPQNKNN